MNSNNDSDSSQIHIVLTKSQKGMIKQVIAGKKPVALACLEILSTLVEFECNNEKLREILQKEVDRK